MNTPPDRAIGVRTERDVARLPRNRYENTGICVPEKEIVRDVRDRFYSLGIFFVAPKFGKNVVDSRLYRRPNNTRDFFGFSNNFFAELPEFHHRLATRRPVIFRLKRRCRQLYARIIILGRSPCFPSLFAYIYAQKEREITYISSYRKSRFRTYI